MIKSRVGKVIPKDQIKEFIGQSHWSIKKIINPNPEKIVSHQNLKKILKLSGLNENTTNAQSIIDSLNLQLSFIKSLYKEGEKVSVSNNDKIFRLIKSDNVPEPPLTLKTLEEQVKNIDKLVDPNKGEIGFEKGDFFTIKSKH